MNAKGKSVTGLHRKNNEDSIYVSQEKKGLENLYIVADGMGGHKAGEVASNYSIELFVKYINDRSEDDLDRENILDTFISGVSMCNEKVFLRSLAEDELSGMGTTFTCVHVDKDMLYGVHVGDSRAYILRGGKLRQITKDHSFVMEMVKQGKLTPEEALVHPKRNLITRAVGSDISIVSDTIIEKIEKDDIILLCTDGLSNMLNEDEMAEIILRGKDIEEIIDLLIDEANKKGGSDNISAVIIDLR